jgi:hypothetical protein
MRKLYAKSHLEIRCVNKPTFALCLNHRYLNKCRLLKFCYVPTTSADSSEGILAATTNSTNQANKVDSMCR